LAYSTASDIWALGVTIWEIVTGSNPATQMPLIELAVAIRDQGYHPRIPAYLPDWLNEILEGCWHKEPGSRISLSRILTLLDDESVAYTDVIPSIGVTTNKKKKAAAGGGGGGAKKGEVEKLKREIASLKSQLDEANAMIAAYQRSGAVLPTKSGGWTKGDQRKSLVNNDKISTH